jgi:hypothetical protein
MIEAPSLNKAFSELNETHIGVKNLVYFDKFKLDITIAILYDCISAGHFNNNEELINILQELKKDLPGLDEEKINKHKKELMKFLKGAKN